MVTFWGRKSPKIAEKRQNRPKNKTLEASKIGENGAKSIFCPFCDPPKPGVEWVDGDLLGSKISQKWPKNAKNETLGAQK